MRDDEETSRIDGLAGSHGIRTYLIIPRGRDRGDFGLRARRSERGVAGSTGASCNTVLGRNRPVPEGLRPKCVPAVLRRLPVGRATVPRVAPCRPAFRPATRFTRYYEIGSSNRDIRSDKWVSGLRTLCPVQPDAARRGFGAEQCCGRRRSGRVQRISAFSGRSQRLSLGAGNTGAHRQKTGLYRGHWHRGRADG